MLQINQVIAAQPNSGDGTTLQPASPLSPEVKAQLFDEFVITDPAARDVAEPVGSQTIFFGLVLAAVLAGVALYIIRQVRPHDPEN